MSKPARHCDVGTPSIRRKLGRSVASPSLIETVYGSGYRLATANVEKETI
jgi:DNA-binding response OmpR family regulator